MSIFLDKLISVFVSPLEFAIFEGLFFPLLGVLGWRKFKPCLLLPVFLGLCGFSTPWFVGYALRSLEQGMTTPIV
jgi:hypothetical protein